MQELCREIGCILLTAMLLSVANAAPARVPAAEKPDLSTGSTLYAVGYAHLDTQWRWDYVETINKFLPNTLNENFRLIDKYPNYIFNFSGANRYRMIKEYYPADYQKLKQYVAAGRWFPCGSSMEECDVNAPSAESIIRQVLYGNDYFRREFGQASAEFMLPDCFGFPASLPSLLGHCGVKGFSTQKLSWGSAVGIPFNVGIWEGPNGTSVIAALNPGSYGAQIGEDMSKNQDWLKRVKRNGERSGVFADYFYYGTGDVGGSPTEGSVKWADLSVTSDGPLKVISSPADQLFLDIKPEQASKLPRFKGDMLLTEHSAGSISSQAYMKRLNRKCELLADAAEKASVAAEWMGGLDYPKSRLLDAWTLVMGGQFHDILPGTSIPKAYEYSWNDDILALNQFADVLQHAVGTISSGLDTRGRGVSVVVYNPLGISRDDIAEATVAFPGAQPAAVKVVGPDGKQTASQVIDRRPSSLKILFVASAPSVGLAVYDVRAVKNSPAAGNGLTVSTKSLENRRYRVAINADGDVASIYDKTLKRELLESPIRYAFTYDNPREWAAWNMDWDQAKAGPRGYVDGNAKIRVMENGPVRVALEIERNAEGSRFVQTIRLSAGSAGDRIEFADTIDWRGKECNLKAVFPLTASNPKATYNWDVGTVQRGNDDPRKYEVPSHQWFDLTDKSGDYGVTVLSDCKIASSKPNDNTLSLTLLRTPGVRGGWEDQATQDWGRHEISYGLSAHKSGWQKSGTNWQALRLEQPLIAFQCEKHSGKLGKTLSMVRISNPGVRVMALKKNETSDNIVIRLVETQGQVAKGVRVDFPGKVVFVSELNGQEESIAKGPIDGDRLTVNFTPYQLRTFAVKLAASPVILSGPKSQPITLPHNECVTSRDGQKCTSGFDTDSRRIAAEMLPERIDDNGLIFKLAGDDKPNAVACNGQSITLPKGKFSKLVLLAAASNGDKTGTFEVDGKQTSLKIQDWGGFIGQWDNRLWQPTDETSAEGWIQGCSGLVPGYIKRAPVAWFCSHRHDSAGANEPYNYTYLYRYSISIPAGAKTLRLPKNESIKILAASVAIEPAAGVRPAQALYDTLEDHSPLTCAFDPTKR